MPYSSIIIKSCRCGCGKPKTLGYGGYNFACNPVRREEIIKKHNAKQRLNQKVRSLSRTEGNKELSDKQKWFKLIRTKLTGTCQCGCGNKSQKDNDEFYRHSCCHILPQRIFFSVQFHPLNYVERAFWGGCHTNLDQQSMDKWVNMADWEDIREKFFILAAELTDMEKASKFYKHLEMLVYATSVSKVVWSEPFN